MAIIAGTSGDDVLVQNAGQDDDIDGGAGSDTLDLSSVVEATTLYLSSTNPQSIGASQGIDTIRNVENAIGTTFADLFVGNNDNNRLDGGAGADNLQGRNGDDMLIGGTGNDTLIGGAGLDEVFGGDGDDFIRVGVNDEYDNIDGGSGTDTLDRRTTVDGGNSFDFVNELLTNASGQQFMLAGLENLRDGGGDNQFILPDSVSFLLETNGGDDIVYENSNGGNNNVDLGEGDDRLYLFSLNRNDGDVFDGGDGIDTIDLSGMALSTNPFVLEIDLTTGVMRDQLDSGSDFAYNFEHVIGTSFGDTIRGTNDFNHLIGRGGRDEFIGSPGNDILDGTNGDGVVYSYQSDFVTYGDGAGDVTINLASGTAVTQFWGTDTLIGIASAKTGDGNDRMYGDALNNFFIGGAGDDYASLFEGRDSFSGGLGNDRAYLGAGDDSASGGEGNDTLVAGDGKDRLKGGDGNDRLYGEAGNDELLGEDGNDLIVGGAGNDELTGAAGDDRLYGVADRNTLLGGEGNDVLVGGTGRDVLRGEEGNDRIYFGWGDSVFDLSGGAGYDRLIAQVPLQHFELGEYSFEAAFGSDGADNIRATWLNERTVLVGFDGSDWLVGGKGNDLIEGRNDNDGLYGGLGADTLLGGAGDDDLFGYDRHENSTQDGNDRLFGGDGDDYLSGGHGSDFMDGGAGSDSFFGYEGNDEVRIDSEDIETNIKGGNGTDIVRLMGNDAFDFNLEAQDFEIGFGNSAANVLDGRGSNFYVTLYGNGGDDTLYGGNRADKLVAGDGDDTIHGGNGADSMNGGSGNDVATFDGVQSDYTIQVVNPGVSARVTHLASGDVDTLSGIESVMFLGDGATVVI